MARFIENLKNKPEHVKKFYALMISGAIAVIVAGIALFSLFGNLHALSSNNKSTKEAVVVKKAGAWQQIKSVFSTVKAEVATTTNEVREAFRQASATATPDMSAIATTTATTTDSTTEIVPNTAKATTSATTSPLKSSKSTGKRN